jgi:hypothetical protein
MAKRIYYCTSGCPGESAPHPFMAAYWLKTRGYEVRIICQGGRGSFAASSVLGTGPVTSLPNSGVAFQASLTREILRQRARHGGNAVYYLHGHVVTQAAYFALLGVSRQRIIYHTQDFIEPGRYPHWEFFERRFARRAGWVISNEINRARALMSCYGLKQMPTVVPTALPKDWLLPDRDSTLRQAMLARVGREDDENCRLIMHEGGFAQVRCGRQLVEAFTRLPVNFILVFTGLKPASEEFITLQRLTSEHGLASRVVVLERLDFGDLLRHTASCDAGILLYPNDGIGNFYQCPGRLTHYLGCGLPVVASNFPGLELLTLKHDLGKVCDPQSSAAIAEAIRSVAGRTKGELARQAVRLRNLSRGELAYETYAGKIEEIVMQLGHPPG